uniref:Uncharacterized protein n=1 Tax=viral metagenome TaxID=1070528 RepID=A0A6C0ESM0_9ZZZZ
MSLTPPIIFNVDVIADKDKVLEAKIVSVKDSATPPVTKSDATGLSQAFAQVVELLPKSKGGSSSQSSRGGKSRKGKKSKGGKSRKSRKSLRKK